MAGKTKTTPKAGETESPAATSPNTDVQSLKEELGVQKEESLDPNYMVTDYAYELSNIVKNHHTNSDVSKKSDYNQLMHKIENLKSDILKFIN